MEDQPASTKHCSNCKRDVAEGNFVMHEIHCRKNIVLCSKCNEPVPKVSLEEHIEENHALVNCELCTHLVERSRLEEHKGSLCSKRCEVCAFCELSVPADELGKHESYCGTRTELCTKCLQYIMHKDRLTHEESNCRLPERIDPIPKPDADPFDLPGYSYFDHPDHWSDYRSFASEVQRSDIDRSRHERFLQEFSDYFEPGMALGGLHALLNTGAQQNRTDADRLHRGRQTTEDELCDDFLKFAQAKKSNVTKDSKVSKDVHSNLPPQDVSLLPCEFCDETFPGDEIFGHQVICSSQFDEPDLQVTRNYGPNLLRDYIAEPLPPKSSFVESGNDDGAMLLPCEFCEDLYPTEDLMFHQMNCEVRQLIAPHEPEESSGGLKRPPSLPSGLDQVEDLSSVPTSLKPSSSIPLRLSQLGMDSSQSSAPRKPVPAAALYHQRLPAASGTRPLNKPASNLVKKPITRKQPSLEDRAGYGSREVQPGRRSMDAVGLIPLGRDEATVRRVVPLQQPSLLAPRSNARGTSNAARHSGPRSRPTNVTDISASSLSGSNHSRGMAARPTGANHVNQLATRPAVVRPESDTSTRVTLTNYLTSSCDSQKKNSRTLPEPPSKS